MNVCFILNYMNFKSILFVNNNSYFADSPFNKITQLIFNFCMIVTKLGLYNSMIDRIKFCR